MLDFEYVFVLRGELAEEFCSQTEELSELILELGARKQLPKTWKLVDWLRTRPKAAPEVLEKRKKHQTVLGLLVLLLALFALGPTMIAPKELLPVLLAGAVCLGAGIVSLWKRHRIMLAIPDFGGAFLRNCGLGRWSRILAAVDAWRSADRSGGALLDSQKKKAEPCCHAGCIRSF